MTVKKKTTIDALKDAATKKNPAKSVKKSTPKEKEKQSEFVLSVSKAIDSKEMKSIIHINCSWNDVIIALWELFAWVLKALVDWGKLWINEQLEFIEKVSNFPKKQVLKSVVNDVLKKLTEEK